MPIHVKSEIAPLLRVLLHRPGRELEHIVPNAMERLLFDDIPYLQGAQREHDAFAATLRAQGAEPVYLEDLVAQVLRSDQGLKLQFIEDLIAGSGALARAYSASLRSYLLRIPTERELVLTAMAGGPFRALSLPSGTSLHALLGSDAQFIIEPTPNLYFTRDTFASIGRGVSLNRMYSHVRNRETIYAGYLLQHHPDYAGQVPLYYTPDEPFSIEGGDILNLSASALAVGVSQRTMPEAVEHLAQQIFRDEQSEIRTVLAVSIPELRAFMHLDTVFTQVDRAKFVIHPGVIERLRVFSLTPGAGGRLVIRELPEGLQAALCSVLGCEVEMILCGGGDQITSQREQWNDGANTLCVRPGTVIAYDRNRVTNRILQEHGVTVLEIPSGELSRGRGGPRCMSMPLIRGDLND